MPASLKDRYQKWAAPILDEIAAAEEAGKPGEEIWHLKRKLGIGGSEVGAILGANKYTSRHQLWEKKMGIAEPFPGNLATKIGHLLENTVAEEYAARTGNTVEIDETHYQSETDPWLVGNIDRKITFSDGSIGVLECKTASMPTDDWGDGNLYGVNHEVLSCDSQVPDSYYFQCFHYMNLLKCNQVDLCVLFLINKEVRIYTIKRDERLIGLIKRRVEKFFWENIVEGKEPEKSAAEINKIPKSDIKLESKECTSDLMENVKMIRSLKADIKEKEKALTILENAVKEEIGYFESLTYKGNTVCTYKGVEKSGFDAKKFKEENPAEYSKYETITRYRVLRFSKEK